MPDTMVLAVVRELMTPVMSPDVTVPEAQLPISVVLSVDEALLRLLTTAARLLFKLTTTPGALIACKEVMAPSV
jgi:hypothetical protein